MFLDLRTCYDDEPRCRRLPFLLPSPPVLLLLFLLYNFSVYSHNYFFFHVHFYDTCSRTLSEYKAKKGQKRFIIQTFFTNFLLLNIFLCLLVLFLLFSLRGKVKDEE